MISRAFLVLLLAGCSADEAAFRAADAALDGAAHGEANSDRAIPGDAALADAAPGDAGWADATPDATPDAGGPFVEVGTGARTFAPLEEGQRIPIIQGIQGGFHVWGGVRGAGFDDTNVQVIFRLRQDAMLLATSSDLEGALPQDASGLFAHAGVLVMFIDNAAVEAVSGTPLILDVQVRTAAGMTLTDAVEVVPLCCEQ